MYSPNSSHLTGRNTSPCELPADTACPDSQDVRGFSVCQFAVRAVTLARAIRGMEGGLRARHGTASFGFPRVPWGFLPSMCFRICVIFPCRQKRWLKRWFFSPGGEKANGPPCSTPPEACFQFHEAGLDMLLKAGADATLPNADGCDGRTGGGCGPCFFVYKYKQIRFFRRRVPCWFVERKAQIGDKTPACLCVFLRV